MVHSCSLPTARYFLFIFRLTQKMSVLSGYTVVLPAGYPPLLPPPFLLASISLFSVRLVFSITPVGPGVNQYGHTGLLFHPMGSFFHCRCAPPALAAADFPFAAAMHVPLPPTCTLSLFNQKKNGSQSGHTVRLAARFILSSFLFLLSTFLYLLYLLFLFMCWPHGASSNSSHLFIPFLHHFTVAQ